MALDHASSASGSSPLSSVPASIADSDSELSVLSHSPSPPPDFMRYPSPSSSMSSKRSSARATPAREITVATPPSSADDNGPPRKKRKTAGPKQRTTQRLHIEDGVVADDERPQMERLLKVLHKKRKIVVIAGAGISVSAGIPDFRSSDGLFKSLRTQHKLKSSGKDLFDASVYQNDSSTSSFHDMVRTLSQNTKEAQPTAFHHLLATLAHEGRLLRLYTQNVDGIDTSLPPLQTTVPLPKKAPWPKTVQLHGGLDHMVCSKCHTLSDLDAAQFDGPVPPACPSCAEKDEVRQAVDKRSHGIGRLRPRMVLYNEHNPDDEAIGACASLDLRTRPDAVIVAGTTLKVPGVRRIAREMCAVVRDRRDGVTVWLNNDPEPLGKDLANSWDIVVRAKCDDVAHLAAMRKWDDPIVYKEVTDEELGKTKEKQKARVVVAASPKKRSAVEQVQGQMLTPAQSPKMVAQPSLNSDDSELPPTPTKTKATKTKGTKRKSGGLEAFVKRPSKPRVDKQQAAPRKKKAAKAKAENTNRITNQFSAVKNSAKPTESKFIPYKPDDEATPPAKMEENTIPVLPLPEPTTPKLKLTKWKEANSHLSRTCMAELPCYHARNNGSPGQSPVHPAVEPFTSPPSTPNNTPPASSDPASDTADTADPLRPTSSGSIQEEMRRIEEPTGKVPICLKSLLIWN
ncbi:DHS-like NAD/FAD-binding domain-containing protein [Polyplosphaeria fusca]|uniref:DHS-like NAD/FAD-binding domain-containing protein n=1 Tax=Polyplosphaeria fusca TaxID=682080 RepID=A0A9P4QWZ1_9PLEO|nr:DHS-like NAD/FAD-binding domain-containing protein [Polyplosphaeria fusca]